MGKRRNKSKRKTVRRGGSYGCEIAPFVTNWNGVLLDPQSRKEVKQGDVVRVLIRPDCGTRYVEILGTSGKYLTGKVADPYYGGGDFSCNECRKFMAPGEQFWSCLKDIECWDYHNCKGCYDKKIHEHHGDMTRYPFVNGTLVTFKRGCISEIPNWTPNAIKIIKKYKNPENLGRGFTGIF